MKKRMVCMLLVLSMLLSVIPAASAAEAAKGPRFATYYLTLNESIDVNFKLTGYDGKDFDRVEFIKGGEVAQTIRQLPTPVSGNYVFKFTELSPDELGEVITARLYTKGSNEAVCEANKSVRNYCDAILGDANQSAELKTLVVDLLNYGTAFQVYKAKNAAVEDPANKNLPDVQKNYATQGDVKLTDIQNAGNQSGYPVQWKSFGLTLKNVVSVYFYLAAESMDGLTLRISAAGKTWEITEFNRDSSTGQYRVDFDRLNPIQMSEAITAQVFRGNTAVSSKLTTSIESYAASEENETVKAVVTEMMKYGKATKYWWNLKNAGQATDSVIYVSTKAAANTGDGSFENPYASIEEARNAIREIKAAGKYPAKGIAVSFRGGQYSILNTVKFDGNDSGEDGAPVVYKPYNGETVEFVGGVSFDASKFKTVTDIAVLNRLPEAARGKVKQVKLADLGITDYGKMHVYGMAAGYFSSSTVEVQKAPPPELFFNGKVLTVSRYPNEGWLSIASVIETGDVIQNWTNGAFGNDYIPESERPTEVTGSTFTVPRQIRSRMLGWSEASDIWVYGFWKENWSDQSIPVESIHAGAGIVKTEIPSGKEITVGKRFYFYNLLEELDVPGEYYVERGAENNGILYAYLPEQEGTLTYSTLNGPTVNLNGVKHMQFQGISFVGGRSRAIAISNSEDVIIADAEVSNFALNAINLSDCKNVTVTGCHIHDTGSGGISVGYGSGYKEERQQLKSMGIVIENCEIHDFSRIAATYAPAVSTNGVGMIVRNCKIYNADHMAISLGGNDTVIENCEIFNVLRTADDSGVIYGGFGKEQMGVVIRNNYIHDIISCGKQNGKDISIIYLDDTKDGVTVESNLFVNISGRGALINGGWDNNFRNNVLINVDTGCTLGCIGMNNTNRYDLKNGGNYASYRAVCAGDDSAYKKYPHWVEKKKALYESEDPVNSPNNNVIENNILFNVNNPVKIGTNNGVWTEQNSKDSNKISDGYAYDTMEQIGFVDYANGDFTLAETSAVRDIAGFEAYDFSKMGLYGEGVQKPKGYGGNSEDYPTPSIGTIITSESLTISDTEFVEEFKTLNQWTGKAINSTATIEGEQLKITMSNTDTVDLKAEFNAECIDRIVYTVDDFAIAPKGSTSMDSNILVVRGKAVTGTVADLLNLKLFVNENGMFFGVIDGNGAFKTDVFCQAGETYDIQLICDPSTNSYDLTINGDRIITGGKLRSYVYTFTGVGINHTNYTEGTAPVVTYGGITAKPAKLTLYEEDFSDQSALDAWKLGDTNTSETKIENGALKVTYKGGNTLSHTARFEHFSGKLVYELDFAVDFGTCTSMDSGIIIVKGIDSNGEEKTLTGLKAKPNQNFGAYDGGCSKRINVKVEENKNYRIRIVCDPVTDTYDFYVDGVLAFDDAKFLVDAVAFNGLTIDQKSMTTTGAEVTFTYDNIRVTSEAGADVTFVGADVSTDNTSADVIEAVLIEDTFDNGMDNWEVGDKASVNDGKQLQISIEKGNTVLYPFKSALPTHQKLMIEFDLTVNGGTDTTFEAGILLSGKKADGSRDTAANINLKRGSVQALYKSTGATYKAGETYKVKIISDPETRTLDVYFAGKKIVSKGSYTRDVIAWDTISLMVKENNTDSELNACFDNFKISKIKTLPTDDFSDGDAANWKTVAGNSAVRDEMLVLSGGNAANVRKEFPSETGTVSIEWEYMLDQSKSADMVSGLALKFGDDSILEIGAKIPTNGTEYAFYAKDGGELDAAPAANGEEHLTEKLCKEMVPYRLRVVVDLERNCYDLYIDGDPIGETRRLLGDAKKLNGIEAFAHSDTTATATAYFDEIKGEKSNEKIGVISFKDYANDAVLPGGNKVDLSAPYKGKIMVEYRVKVEDPTVEAKVYFKAQDKAGGYSDTYLNVGLKNGKVTKTGTPITPNVIAETGEWHTFKIIVDPYNDVINVYVNDALVLENVAFTYDNFYSTRFEGASYYDYLAFYKVG